MSLRLNEALRTKQADDLAAVFAGGAIEIRSGAQPADPDSAASGTLLATIDLPNPAFSAAVVGVISKTGTWTGDTVATATAGWARVYSPGLARWFDVSVGEVGTDMIIDDEDIVNGGIVTVISFTFTMPDA